MGLSVELAPLLPLNVLIGLGLLALAVLAVGILRRGRGAWLRLIATAAVFAALLNPIVRDELRDTLPDVAVVVVDESQSQLVDERDVRTRVAQDQLKDALKNLPDLEVKTVRVRPSPIPDDEGTQLFKALSEALADVPPERFAGTILINEHRVRNNTILICKSRVVPIS